MGKHCQWGLCHNNSDKKDESVFFVPFPKPWIDKPRCDDWVYRCNNQKLVAANVDKNYYVCSDHFQNFNYATGKFMVGLTF